MEFGRFGGNITMGYWGCCACCILQDFNQDPDQKASIQLVDGDGGSGLFNSMNEQLYAGPTYKDIFWQRLRFGTFGLDDMPNHAFLAILTQGQLEHGYGKQWLALLKEAGFEFIRTINNSVYTGQNLVTDEVDEEYEYDYDPDDTSPVHGDSANYLFGLFRNIGRGAAPNPFQPPQEWLDLPAGTPEVYIEDGAALASKAQAFQLTAWAKLPKQDTLLTEAQLREKGAPVTLSGRRVAEAKPKLKPADVNSKEVSLKGAGSKAAAIPFVDFTDIAKVAPPVAPKV